MIENGKKVSMEYTVFLSDGTQIDSNVGEDPLVFVHGANQVFPALEEQIVGMRAGDSKEIVLIADEAYGPVVQEAFREVDTETVPEAFRYAGAILGVQDPSGGVFPIRVHEVRNEKIVLDFNHPLAGKDLKFNVKIVGVD